MHMEKTSVPTIAFATRTYYLLTKPGIIFGNAVTATAGFALGSRGNLDYFLFLMTVVGLSLVIASACVFNNYIDRFTDAKMARTRNRPLVTGLISTHKALLFASLLGIFGTISLFVFTNILALSVALFGFVFYVVFYSFSKYHTTYATLIGSVAGAVPPVVGYCAASDRLDMGALILFAMIGTWQMPHFFAIAIYRLRDYTAASIPLLPIQKGIHKTKVQMALYIAAFIGVSSMLFWFGYVNWSFLLIALGLGLSWLWLSILGFKARADQVWARKMFGFSLVVVMGISFSIPFLVR